MNKTILRETTQKVVKAFELQKEMNILLGKNSDFEVDSYHDFIFMAKSGRPLMPQMSAHNMRHTSCTRMAECRVDIKVLQCIMVHAHINVTMNVYNHIGNMARVDNEIATLNTMALSY